MIVMAKQTHTFANCNTSQASQS